MTRTSTLVICVPDCHFPDVHPAAWDWTLRQIKLNKPDLVVQLGDMCDFKSLSMHAAEFGDTSSLAEELSSVRTGVQQLEVACTKAGSSLVLLGGNHEHRLQRYVAAYARKLESVVPPFRDLFGVNKHTVVMPYQETFVLGKVHYVHDLGYSGPGAARQNLDATQRNIITGHTHRADIHYSGTVDGERHFSMTCGWLGDATKITYVPQAKTRFWTLGLGVVRYSKGGFARARFEPFPG